MEQKYPNINKESFCDWLEDKQQKYVCDTLACIFSHCCVQDMLITA